MAPVVHGLESKYGAEVNFVYLDRDDPRNAEFLETLGFRYQPHFFLVDAQGHVLKQWVGYVGVEVLEEAIVSVQ
ncbi:MAG: hypothetical protein PHS96_06780 [Anaerolineales bacterium]|nr:hypothetical protein [Anaerolineales bacterium]